MPYKSRGIYKEEGKVRDYNLFVIVAEGSVAPRKVDTGRWKNN